MLLQQNSINLRTNTRILCNKVSTRGKKMTKRTDKKPHRRLNQGVVIGGCVAAIILLALYFGTPASEEWPLKCPLFQLTGWQCPLCGTQRALHEMAHGNVAEAWRYNPGLWVTLPYFIIIGIASLAPRMRKHKVVAWLRTDKMFFCVIALLLVWGVTRNLI